MAQYIDMRYKSRATSSALNQRFGEITGPCVLRGYRMFRGTDDFSVSLMTGGYTENVAISPSGARVEEDTDLIDILQVEPNSASSGAARIDSVFLHFEYGVEDKDATYKVVKGTPGNPPTNPNKNTHLLLGYVYVYPNNQTLRDADIISIPYGFADLKISGNATFSGTTEFDGEVIFNDNVTFTYGSGGDDVDGGDGTISTVVERMGSSLLAEEGQTDIVIDGTYEPNTKSLFVYRNGKLQPPNKFQEVDRRTFRFHDPLSEGEEVWAFWYKGLNAFTPEPHNHDRLYFRKDDMVQRLPRFATDYFSGMSGRVITHNLGHRDYNILGITPVEKAEDVGQVTTEKRDNEIIVYNSGAYRGAFDLAYLTRGGDGPTGSGETPQDSRSQYNIESMNYDEDAGVFRTSRYRRFDGTVHFESTLENKDGKGNFTRLKVNYYNQAGSEVIMTQEWALTYDNENNIKNKTLISS